jgi:hypothetical protein
MVAMSIFSFMLLIVTMGFINIVHIHNQAVASNIAQDNARAAMDELVRGVRTSNGILPSAAGTLCLTSTTSGQQTIYYVQPVGLGGILYRADSASCTAPGLRRQALTSNIVSVTNFAVVVPVAATPKSEVSMTLTVASNNGTAPGGVCGPTNSDRTFCSVITLTSGAVPR